jgi:hypothetical protein
MQRASLCSWTGVEIRRYTPMIATSSFTAAADFCAPACSSAESLNWRIYSIPPPRPV